MSNSSQQGIDTTRTYKPSADEISYEVTREDERERGRDERGGEIRREMKRREDEERKP
jgi:hypothetical protein